MISAIAAIQPPDDVAQSTAARKAPPQSKAGSHEGGEDTVHLSSTAQQALTAASQAKPAEAIETFAQTIAEAGAGDIKAIAILAKK